MPVMGGLDFLKKQLRIIPEYKSTKVIIYTTSSNQKDKDESCEAGSNGFITKHYSFDALEKEPESFFRMEE